LPVSFDFEMAFYHNIAVTPKLQTPPFSLELSHMNPFD